MDAEGHARLAAARHRPEHDPVPCRVYVRLGQHPAQRCVGTGGRPDAQPLDRRHISRLGSQAGTQHQDPEGMLGQRRQQLRALPAGEGRRSCVGRTGHEVDGAVPQPFHGLSYRKDHFQLCVYSLSLKVPQLHGGHRREV